MKASDASKKFLRQPKKPIVMSTASNLQVLYEDNHIIAVNKRSSDIVQGDGKGDGNGILRIIKPEVKADNGLGREPEDKRGQRGDADADEG